MELKKTILKIVMDIKTSMQEALYALRIQKKVTSKFDVDVEIIDDHYNIDTFKGRITPNKTLTFIPKLGRPIFNPILYSKDSRNIIICSEKQHDNMSHAHILKIDAGLKSDLQIRTKLTKKQARYIIDNKFNDHKNIEMIMASWELEDIWTTIEIKDVGGSLDFKKFDNKFSVPFAAQSNMIVDSEMLKFLLKPSDGTLLTVGIIAFLAGVVMGVLFGGG